MEDSRAPVQAGPVGSLSESDSEKLNLPEVKRIANISQIYFLDYYFDLLTYIHARRERLAALKRKKEVLSSQNFETAWKNYTGRERVALRKKRTRVRNGDFQMLTQVGQGGYGQVYLARKVDTKEICALKVMNKKHLAVLDEVRHVLTERDILTVSDSPWLVRLLYAFQDEESIYFAMEFVAGGDFRTLLNNARVLRNQHCRFYIAEMFMCVHALHVLGYIHRDLKPENFLIDSSGHLKLTDFGLSAGIMNPDKINRLRQRLDNVKDTNVPRRSSVQKRQLYESVRKADKAYATSIVGSPDYMAPEILKGEGYDFSVDFWSLGCILYEALAGYPPFVGANIDETWSNLKHWDSTFTKPDGEDGKPLISETTWSFLLRLICKPNARFKDILQVQQHPYFSSIDWPNIRKQNPPFIPELDSDVDAGYFDDFSNEDDMAKYKDVQIKQQHLEDLAAKEAGNETGFSKGAFVGFTYRRRPLQQSKPRTLRSGTEFSTMF